jgi:hypothetical protein
VPEQTGVLVVRVWVEGDQPLRLRGRITRTSDVTRRDEVSTVASSADEIKTVVHTWLNEFERSMGLIWVTGSAAERPSPERR